MDITESELAWALRTTKIMVHDKDGLADLAGFFSADTLVTRGKGVVWLPEEHAAMLLRKIADDQRRRRAEEAQCRAEGARCDREGGPRTCPCGPEAEAAALRDVVNADIPDPEVAAIAAIVAAMDRLDGETALLGTDVHERVIRWAMGRYLGPVSDGG
jgi:hypothetical protein